MRLSADLPIEDRPQDEQPDQRRQKMPALQAGRLHAPDGAGERGGSGPRERIKRNRAPTQPEQQTGKIQDEINQRHLIGAAFGME